MRKTHYSNTSLYPTATFEDKRNPEERHLELCHSRVTDSLHIIPHVDGEIPKKFVTIDKEEAVKVLAFLKEFILA